MDPFASFLIEFFLLSFGWLSLGYFLGYLNGSKKDFKEFVDETGQVIRIETKKLVNPVKSVPTGRIKPVTAQEAAKKQMNPDRREALEEMKRTLDNIPELVQAKELAQAMKKEEYGKV